MAGTASLPLTKIPGQIELAPLHGWLRNDLALFIGHGADMIVSRVVAVL